MQDSRAANALCNALGLAALLTLGVLLPQEPHRPAAHAACHMNGGRRVLQCPRLPAPSHAEQPGLRGGMAADLVLPRDSDGALQGPSGMMRRK